MSLWQSYRNLSTRTRIIAGVGIMAYALGAQYLSDQAEKSFGFTPTAEERERLENVMPKIRVVDKDG